jgi:hypothetical protein
VHVPISFSGDVKPAGAAKGVDVEQVFQELVRGPFGAGSIVQEAERISKRDHRKAIGRVQRTKRRFERIRAFVVPIDRHQDKVFLLTAEPHVSIDVRQLQADFVESDKSEVQGFPDLTPRVRLEHLQKRPDMADAILVRQDRSHR